MKAIRKFCYDHPNFGVPELMKFIALGNVAVYIADMLMNGIASQLLAFYPGLILQGQVWRLLTFVFVPMSAGGGLLGPLFFALTTYFYYWIGTSLERQWGTARFNVFYLLGIILNIIVGFVVYAVISGQMTAGLGGAVSDPQIQQTVHDMLLSLPTANMYYVNLSLFFSFATLYPDMQVLLYGVIPLKVKWLAWLDVLFFAWDIFQYLSGGLPVQALLPVIAILNYLIFFWEDLMSALGRGRARVQHRTSAQTINFKKAQREIQQKRGYLHKCSVCGITDADNPDMEFRYCSKCNGYYCYCADHINNHTHVQ